jgi:hypothetical protein
MTFDIARELLDMERERLLRDHYDTVDGATADGETADDIGCDGCLRAIAVRAELEALANIGRLVEKYTR